MCLLAVAIFITTVLIWIKPFLTFINFPFGISLQHHYSWFKNVVPKELGVLVPYGRRPNTTSYRHCPWGSHLILLVILNLGVLDCLIVLMLLPSSHSDWPKKYFSQNFHHTTTKSVFNCLSIVAIHSLFWLWFETTRIFKNQKRIIGRYCSIFFSFNSTFFFSK